MSRIKIWNKVPDRSTLHVRVEGGTGTAQGILTVSDDTARDLNDEALRTGTTIQLRAARKYRLLLALKFAKSSTMTVKARIEKPGGEQHGKLFEEPVAGTPGEVKAVEIKAFMLKAEES
ncbi:MAG TPA: hypothetical protein VF789_29295 [Thermoanaerobaculia bacterium]